MTDWLALLTQAAAIALPVMGLQVTLHRLRNTQSADLKSTVDKLDKDLGGLVKQMGDIVIEVERRFVTKSDHSEAVRQLNQTMGDLNDNIAEFNRRLFDLVKQRANP